MKIPPCDKCKGKGYTKINSDKSRIVCSICNGTGEDNWANFMTNRYGVAWLKEYLSSSSGHCEGT